MSRSFAGEMKRHCQRALKPQITVPVLRSTGWLPPFFRCKHCPTTSSSRRPSPGDGRWMELSASPPPPTPARQHAGDGEVKGVSLNSHAPHAVPSDCSFPGLPRPLPAAGCRPRCASLCVRPCLSCVRTGCGKQLTMVGRAGRPRLPLNSPRPAI
ncbi:hypothetical protein PAHAL_4G310100 [Panicum hallii]|jgi:hypothetical protein|uniref:Uncharacterized protein n=1 Tax=Panicum hallii TaxID=206008 RepID=A0A2T8JEI3_9POAL|nr:hypothetical protein PAHAL_4G310100 [Panicum hallii]